MSFCDKGQINSSDDSAFLVEKEGKLALEESHIYHYQIQGQLFCTNSKYCYLVVFTLKEVKFISAKRDDIFIIAMIENLNQFYKQYFRKAVLERFFSNFFLLKLWYLNIEKLYF